ncbi:PrgI family protein [Streptococcus sp. S784/96/1]|uniref:PrgI family protein n=1 Tax=Streptococcus sp. S784/96/1 TaxID=2653499 RepID=UPI00138667DA|nr:PrgI family protein [Streptococcus sp. S784/96/1]
MEKLGSYFLDDFETVEKTVIFNMTKRHLLLIPSMVLIVLSMAVIFFFELPDLLAYLIGGVFAPPVLIYGLSLDRTVKAQEKIRFALMVQERTYQTEYRKDREYQINEFIQKKNIKETDSF